MILSQISVSITTPIFAICVWVMLGSLLGSAWMTLKEGWDHIRRLHNIPCNRCAYFTDDYRLKCTVHPCKALTEEAIGCLDYEPTPPCLMNTCPKRCKQSK